MKGEWDLVFHQQAVVAVAAARGREKTYLVKAFEELLKNPYRIPDYEERDSSGRVMNVFIKGPWAITFWLDSFVKEIRIVVVERIGN